MPLKHLAGLRKIADNVCMTTATGIKKPVPFAGHDAAHAVWLNNVKPEGFILCAL